ncbi:formylglycine-generating enzyme family protein [Pedobacter chinensis]|nr:SUMF1/EgtB/PvdO family nonheme iron enzyme [Pedobacter chinensis]
MVEIPAGAIMMRDDRIKSSWTVQIFPFLLSKHLVTQELFYRITNTNPSTFKGTNLPVETVSWRDAVLFCNTLSTNLKLKPCYSFDLKTDDLIFDYSANGYRLPTEAEWEYACRAGSTGIRYGKIEDIAWYKTNSNNTTQPIGLKTPNAWGLYDMLGNVWEWCSDIYDESVYGSYRIIRGGGWCDEERSCMVTNRRRSHPKSFKIDDLGFRIARNL